MALRRTAVVLPADAFPRLEVSESAEVIDGEPNFRELEPDRWLASWA
jgi:hypothetical protein